MAKSKALKKPKTVAYLRVSTIDQDTEKNKAEILKLSNDRDFGQVIFVEEKASGKKSWKDRKIKGIIDGLGDGDRLLVPELSRLGRSMLEIMEMLSIAKQKGIYIYAVKGGWELNGSIQSKVMAMAFSIAAEKVRKAMGIKLGRPKGPGKSKLDSFKEEIIALLKNGSTKKHVALKYGTTPPNLHNWLRKNSIDAKPVI